MVVVKKVLCILLAVMFVVCVYCYGTNDRFSLEKYVNNIVDGFSGLPTIEDFSKCWTEDYVYKDGVTELVYWVHIYDSPTVSIQNGKTPGEYVGYFPLAYRRDGSMSDKVTYQTHDVLYDENGDRIELKMPNGDTMEEYPVVYDWKYEFAVYDGENELIGFFWDIGEFFQRLDATIMYIVYAVDCVFHNMHVLLPWNSTVKEV